MKQILKVSRLLTTLILALTITLSSNLLVFAVTTQPTNNNLTNTTQQPQTFIQYGIAIGDGQTTTVYLKVANDWQQYELKGTYKGTEAQAITLDRELTVDNYLEADILSIDDIDTQDNDTITDINNMIDEFNQLPTNK